MPAAGPRRSDRERPGAGKRARRQGRGPRLRCAGADQPADPRSDPVGPPVLPACHYLSDLPDSERFADCDPFAVRIASRGSEHAVRLDAANPVAHVFIAVPVVQPVAVAIADGVDIPVPVRLRLGQPVGVPHRPQHGHGARYGDEPRPGHKHGPRQPDRQHELRRAGRSDRRDVRTHGSAAASANLTPGGKFADDGKRAPGGKLAHDGKLADDGKRASGDKFADDGKCTVGGKVAASAKVVVDAKVAGVESFVPAAGPPLFLVSPGELPADVVTLSGAEGHHAAVRRLRAGERANVSDGAGTLAECVVASVARDSVVLSVRSVRTLPPPEPTITVVQALPKGERGELAVELMTEVGADSVIAWAAERCVVRWHGERGARALAKWRATAREAAKQSRRAWLPEVTGPATLSDIAARVSAAACAVVLELAAPTPLSQLVLPAKGEILLIVGPEGGISPAERAALANAGAIEARLGPTVLRTSTAGAAAAAVLLARTGRW